MRLSESKVHTMYAYDKHSFTCYSSQTTLKSTRKWGNKKKEVDAKQTNCNEMLLKL